MSGHCKHAVLHHTYVNITNHDADSNLGLFARLTPSQKRFWFHRGQRVYLWPLYGLWAIKWHLLSDFRNVIIGRIGGRRFSRPTGGIWPSSSSARRSSSSWHSASPHSFHPVWVVLWFYGVAALVLGMTLSVVFQLAHCVEQADFPLPRPDTGRIDQAWAIHQTQTTVNFARRSVVAASGRLELPDRTPPVPPDLPHQLRGHVEGGGGHLSRIWRAVHGTPVCSSGAGLAFPLVATDGDGEPDQLSV
jgi:hypothetical protein